MIAFNTAAQVQCKDCLKGYINSHICNALIVSNDFSFKVTVQHKLLNFGHGFIDKI